MADLFEFPEMPREQRSIRLFRTPFPKDPEKSAPKVAKRFGVTGKARDAGARLVFSSQRCNLELFRASDSLRWSEIGKLKSEDDGAAGLPDEKTAVESAAAYLKDHGLALASRRPPDVTWAELSIFHRGMKKPETKPVAIHVNYRYELDGLPVFGPGAKTCVTFGGKAKVLECYHFWRATKEEGERPLLPAGRIAEIFRNDEAYAELDAETARVSVKSAEFGYYALPPREYQGMLIPVCAVSGTVSTRVLPRYDFLRYVVAVDFAENDVKELGVVTSRLPRIIN
jgi:hypothetical protein